MPRSIPNNPDFKREPPPVSIDVELANAQRCPGCGGAFCDRGDVCGWRPMPTSEPDPVQIAEALRRAMSAIKATVNHVDQPQGDKVMTSHAPYAAGAIHDEAHRAIFGDNEGQWMALRRRMNNAGFVAGVDFQRRGDALSILDFGRAPTVGIDLSLAEQIREALRRGAKVTIGGESVTSRTIHACGETAARFDVERIAGHWTIIDTETKACMVIAFCPFCGEKLATEGM